MRPVIEVKRKRCSPRPIATGLPFFALAWALGGCVTDGQTGLESAMSSMSQTVAPLLSDISPQAGEFVASLDTSPEKQKVLAAKSAAAVESQHPRVHDP